MDEHRIQTQIFYTSTADGFISAMRVVQSACSQTEEFIADEIHRMDDSVREYIRDACCEIP